MNAGAKRKKKSVPSQLDKRRKVREVAARLRRGEPPNAPDDLVRSAKSYLANRARYNARRAEVRALAAKMRNGRNPRAPDDIRASAKRHLAYRAWYNEDRARKRANPS